jgi:hypothetical protein
VLQTLGAVSSCLLKSQLSYLVSPFLYFHLEKRIGGRFLNSGENCPFFDTGILADLCSVLWNLYPLSGAWLHEPLPTPWFPLSRLYLEWIAFTQILNYVPTKHIMEQMVLQWLSGRDCISKWFPKKGLSCALVQRVFHIVYPSL